MSSETITIGAVELDISAGHPISFQAKQSKNTLSGIDLDFVLRNPQRIEEVDELLTKEVVLVQDPFANRLYEATLHRVSYSFQEGQLDRHYTVQARELDKPEEFSLIEIEGHNFPVVGYSESEHENDAIGRHVLLRLSEEQFRELQRLIVPGPVNVRRVGVDEEPLTVRFGSSLVWSKHSDNYFKQIVRFFPVDFPPGSGSLASGLTQDALVRILHALSVRFEALVEELSTKDLITQTRRQSLLGENWETLIESERRREMAWEFHRVDDAETELD